jgi:phosphoribosylanthranilate isomerase
MALKTKVKVGSITNLSDARYCAGMGVTMLGFPVGGSQGISQEKFQEINGWVTGPELVLEMASAEDAAHIIEQFPAHYIEIDVADLHLFKDFNNLSFIIRVELTNWNTLSSLLHPYKQYIKFLVAKNFQDASMKTIQEAAKHYSILAEYTSQDGELDELIELPIKGIALKGGDELKPGLKDYEQLSGILEQLEVD